MKIEKLKKFKGRKHAMTAGCLLVGMFVLTSAVYANFDDARGYTNYKEAVKNLAFYEENFTANGKVAIMVDGEEFGVVEGELRIDGKDYASNAKSREGSNEYSSIEIVKNGTSYSYYPETNTYYEGTRGDFRPDMKDPTMKKAVRFMELFADTMVGDLKNNFVLTSKEGDERSYSVNVSGSQIPEVVNAGISLMFTAANADYSESNYGYTTYEDYNKAMATFYKAETGKEWNEDEWNEEVEQVHNDFHDKYSDVLDSKGNIGVLYVKADGSYEYYADQEEFRTNVNPASLNNMDVMTLLGTDPYLDNAACNFTLNKEGKLTANEMEASMVGKDESGKKHTITMKITMEVKDYGNTQIEDFDPTGKIKK